MTRKFLTLTALSLALPATALAGASVDVDWQACDTVTVESNKKIAFLLGVDDDYGIHFSGYLGGKDYTIEWTEDANLWRLYAFSGWRWSGEGRPDDPDPCDAAVRVLHLSPDTPAVDIFVDGAAAITDLDFTEGTDYVYLPAGTYDFAAGATGTAIEDAVLNVDGVALAEGGVYSVVAYDYFTDISALLFEDDEDVDAGDTRIRVTHAAPPIGVVDVYADGGLILSGVDFSDSAVIDVPSAAYDIGLDVDADGTPDATFAVPELGGGIVVNAFATVDSDGNPFLLAHLPDGSTVAIAAE